MWYENIIRFFLKLLKHPQGFFFSIGFCKIERILFLLLKSAQYELQRRYGVVTQEVILYLNSLTEKNPRWQIILIY